MSQGNPEGPSGGRQAASPRSSVADGGGPRGMFADFAEPRRAEEDLAMQARRGVVSPDDLARLSGPRDRAVRLGERFEGEYRLRDHTGAYRWHLVRSVPVRDEGGRLLRRFGTATDIDDRKRSEQDARFLAEAGLARGRGGRVAGGRPPGRAPLRGLVRGGPARRGRVVATGGVRTRRPGQGRSEWLVALTGWGQEADRQRSKEAGFDAHLVKPVDPEDLRKLVLSSRPDGERLSTHNPSLDSPP